MAIQKTGVIPVYCNRKLNGSIGSLLHAVKRDKYLLLLILPVVIYFAVFQYGPMYGVYIAFNDYTAGKGILGSPWNNFENFKVFFHSSYFFRNLRNTILLNGYGLLWGFPIPIVFALLLNEYKDGQFKKFTQTVSYIPHFISTVVIVGMIFNFLSPTNGLVNSIIKLFGYEAVNFMVKPEWFRTIFISSGIWKGFGFGSVIYLAAISSIDPQLYDASTVDGATRWHKLRYITLPGILPTIVILLILDIGSIMQTDFTKILLMYNSATYETADVISTYAYRTGIVRSEYSYGAAIGLFNSTVNLCLLILANKVTKKLADISLW